MLKHHLRKILLVLTACFLALAAAIPASAAGPKRYENGMLTPPPPDIYKYHTYIPGPSTRTDVNGVLSIQSMASGNLYLMPGRSDIAETINGEPVYTGVSSANVICQQIGITAELQRWTGSYWVTEKSSSFTSYNNAAAPTTDATKVYQTGYYYRTYSTHWLDYNGVHEVGNSYSPFKAF
ncbi:hypothetical protein [Gorillibacterium sp. sgz5001074]|uniref:hypothetical protein n=1 Tax=Gorillibacterium sp. sgz5001074 TaxID=3446695 RepID=UPI003F67CA3A